jgi:hypothetical protein
MDELKDLDKVAYVRFASVYRSFEDIREFGLEIAKLGQGAGQGLDKGQPDEGKAQPNKKHGKR